MRSALPIAALLVLAACGGGKPTGQVVATVNGDEITESMITAEAAAAGLTGVAASAQRPQLIQRVVDRTLLVQQARQQKLDRTPVYLAQSVRAQQTILAQMVLPQLVGQPVPPTDKAVADFLAKNGSNIGDQTVIAVDQLVFPLTAARKDVRWLDDINDMATAEETLRGMGIKFQRGASMLQARQLPPQLARQLLSASSDKLFYFKQDDMIVILRPIEKSVVHMPDAVQAGVARNLLGRAAQQGQIAAALKALRDKATIEYKAGAGPAAPKAAAKS